MGDSWDSSKKYFDVFSAALSKKIIISSALKKSDYFLFSLLQFLAYQSQILSQFLHLLV